MKCFNIPSPGTGNFGKGVKFAGTKRKGRTQLQTKIFIKQKSRNPKEIKIQALMVEQEMWLDKKMIQPDDIMKTQ